MSWTPPSAVVRPNLLYVALYEYLLETDSGPAVRTVSTALLVDRIATAYGEEAVEVALLLSPTSAV